MRAALLLSLAALASACAQEVVPDNAPVIVPRPVPLEPVPPLRTIGPVLDYDAAPG